MKKYFLITTIICLNYSFLFSQVAVKWTKNFGGTGDDQVGIVTNYYDAPDHSIIKTNDGGYASVGYSTSSDIDVASNNGAEDILLIKTDQDGNKLWSKSYGGSSQDLVTSIVQTSDGGFAITGMTSSSDNIFSGNKGGMDVYIIRTDSIGNIIWTKLYGGTNDESSYSILEASNGDLVVGGFTASNDSDITTVTHGGTDYWFLRVSSNGTVINSATYGGSFDEWLNSMCKSPDGGFLLCGWTTSSDFDVTSFFGGRDYWVVKIDSNGVKQWEHSYGASGNDWAASVISINNGYVITGASNSGIVTGSSYGGTDIYTVAIDTIGNVIWQNQFGGSGNDESYEVIHTMDNGYALIGASISDDGQIVGNFGIFDFMICKLDSGGNTLWTKSLGGSALDWPVSAVEANNGDIIAFGSTASNDYYIHTNYGGWDLWMTCLTNNFNVVSGRYYTDLNSNNLYDAGDVPNVSKLITDTISHQYAFTDTSGNYLLYLVDTGNYFVNANSLLYHINSPSDYSGYFGTLNNVDTGKDFASSPVPGVNDLTVSLSPIGRFRPGFSTSYYIHYCNDGTTTLVPTITFVTDPQLAFDSAAIVPSSVNSDTIIFSGDTLNPGQCQTFPVWLHVLNSAGIGDTIISTVNIDAGVPDTTQSNNSYSWTSFVSGSFDPNDKSVNTPVIYSDQLNNPDYLDYVIRFQNTGNDTAFTVLVTDMISDKLDINTLDIVSSVFPVSINFDPLLRILSFKFENILLVDSGTNEPASHGYIHFRIKPNTALAVNDVISNSANIYFDFNDAILTNTVTTEVRLPLFVFRNDDDLSFNIYPNPVKNDLQVNLPPIQIQKIKSIRIYDNYGRMVQVSKTQDKNKLTLHANSFVSGVYFLEIDIDGKTLTRKFIKQ
jgi:uncharacterized repeat protein (TIGR01451 family)